MKHLILIVSLMAMALSFTPAEARHCRWGTEDDAAATMLDVGSQENVRVYVVHDHLWDDLLSDYYWVYLESNGIDGLQRRDYLEDNTCQGAIEPDTWIWHETVVREVPSAQTSAVAPHLAP